MQYVFGSYRLDMRREELLEAGSVVRLDPQVFAVLAYLAQHRDRVAHRQELFEQLWGDRFVSDSALERCIAVARRSVGDSGRRQQVIQTVRGRGYRFIAPVEERPDEASLGEAWAAPDDMGKPGEALGPSAVEAQEAERRQLTVLACRLVGAPQSVTPFDPETWMEALPAYDLICAEIVRRFSGYLIEEQGDGLALAYFGYPQAQEDDACRAVYAGLEIVEAMRGFQARRGREQSGQFAVRVGVHTGMVVMNARGSRDGRGPLALGQTPTIAAQVQGFAPPDAVAISPAAMRLVEGYVGSQPLGAYLLDDAAEPQTVFQALQKRGAPSRFAVAAAKGLTPFVGREAERALLRQGWAQVKEGLGQVIVLSGEPGIGKSRLVEALKDEVAQEPHVLWECYGSPHHQQTPLFPLIAFLPQVFQWLPEDSPAAKVVKLEDLLRRYDLPLPDIVPLFAALWSLPLPESDYPPLTLSPQRQRQKTLDSMVALMLAQAERRPVLFILEDLHWTDPTTLEFLDFLIDQMPTAAILAVLTRRFDFQPAWIRRAYLTEVTVNRLSRQQTARMAQQVIGGKVLPAEVVQHLVDKTDGVPLYIEEMTKMLLEAGYLEEVEGNYALIGSLGLLGIPATLQGLLMARLDRLMTAKTIAQYAAVIGRQFSHELLQAVSRMDHTTLRHELRRLVAAELIYKSGAPPHEAYFFKHALIQEAAYQSVMKRTRNQYHKRIAQVLVKQLPQTVQTQPELLAYHYTEAGFHEQAIDYWQRAGENAIQHSAHREAVKHLTQGLQLLNELPMSPERMQQELMIYVSLGTSLMATQGSSAPEVGHAYNRALELCQQLEDPSHNFPVLFGLWRFYLSSAQLSTAKELASQLLRHAQRIKNQDATVEAQLALGSSLFFMGDLLASQKYLICDIPNDTSDNTHAHILFYGHDPRIIQLSHLSMTLLILGFPEQSRRISFDAIRIARNTSHPYSLVFTLSYSSMLNCLCYEYQDAQDQSGEAIEIASDQDFSKWLMHCTILHKFFAATDGDHENVLNQFRESLGAWKGANTFLAQPFYIALLAKIYEMNNCIDEGLEVIQEAINIIDKTNEHWFKAELYRIKGEFLLKLPVSIASQAEDAFQQALDIARHQQAKLWELRAAMSLSRLWRQQGKSCAAYNLLASIYEWFTEGFDMTDLKQASSLLATLSRAETLELRQDL